MTIIISKLMDNHSILHWAVTIGFSLFAIIYWAQTFKSIKKEGLSIDVLIGPFILTVFCCLWSFFCMAMMMINE
jgi:hypothetical protein